MLTPEQIIEYATRLNSSNSLVSESMLSEALKPEDAVKISKANVKRELPASTAEASPNLICVAGFPLLILSSSIQGKSS